MHNSENRANNSFVVLQATPALYYLIPKACNLAPYAGG